MKPPGAAPSIRRRRLFALYAATCLAATYIFAVHPEVERASEWRQLRRLGVPKSFEGLSGSADPNAIKTGKRFERLFDKWLERDQSADSTITGLTVASTTHARKRAYETEQKLRPVLSEFELILQEPNSYFEKDWSLHPSDIAFPELVHFRAMSKIYIGLGYTAIADGDTERFLHILEALDAIVRHMGSSQLVACNLAHSTLRWELKLIDAAADQWKDKPSNIELLRNHLRKHPAAPNLLKPAKGHALFDTASLSKPIIGQELTFGPKSGLQREWFAKYVYSKPVRLRAEVKILRTYKLILSDGEHGKSLKDLFEDASLAEHRLASDRSVSGQLAYLHFSRLSQVIASYQKRETQQTELEEKLQGGIPFGESPRRDR